MTYYNLSTSDLKEFIRGIQRTIDRSGGTSNDAMYRVWDWMTVTSSVLESLRNGASFTGNTEKRIKLYSFAVAAHKRALDAGVGSFYLKSTMSEPEVEDHLKTKIPGGGWLRSSNERMTGSGAVQFTVSDYTSPLSNPIEGDPPSTANTRDDIVITPLSGWAEGYVSIAPSDALASRYPVSIRSMATRHAVASTGTNRVSYFDELGNIFTVESGSSYPTGQSLLDDARAAYRVMIRSRMVNPFAESAAKEAAEREEHRKKTAANFEAFVRNRDKDTDQHINKLPFVPHGLASSRRWGIEVESGGARGVENPGNGWAAKGDGSLRSAYDGYVEVQDFEPYDEEVSERIHWENCDNAHRHNPSVEVYDSEADMYIRTLREDYLDPRQCELCGNVTRTVRREPTTIRHSSRPGDCREFVSPILTSMHSKGLQQLTEALSKNPQNDSAGVHVHVEASDLSKQQIAIMVYGYDILEPILEASYRRNRRDFCERREVTEVLEAARKARQDGLHGSEGGRYRTLNTHSLSNHGTLEFRAMGPVYEYDYLVRWAMLCRDLVNSVAAGAQTKDFAKIKNWDDLTVFLARFGKEYTRAAIYELTGEVGEAAKLEKAEEPVTASALDADFTTFSNNMASGMVNISLNMQDLGRSLTRAFPTMEQFQGVRDALVTVGAVNEI